MIDGTWTLAVEQGEAEKKLAQSLLFLVDWKPPSHTGFLFWGSHVYSCLKGDSLCIRGVEDYQRVQVCKITCISQPVVEDKVQHICDRESALSWDTVHLSLTSWKVCRQVVSSRQFVYSRKDLILSLMNSERSKLCKRLRCREH
jgi:hypothetical protein